MIATLCEAAAYFVPFLIVGLLFVWSDHDLRERRARRRAIERKRRALERAWSNR